MSCALNSRKNNVIYGGRGTCHQVPAVGNPFESVVTKHRCFSTDLKDRISVREEDRMEATSHGQQVPLSRSACQEQRGQQLPGLRESAVPGGRYTRGTPVHRIILRVRYAGPSSQKSSLSRSSKWGQIIISVNSQGESKGYLGEDQRGNYISNWWRGNIWGIKI